MAHDTGRAAGLNAVESAQTVPERLVPGTIFWERYQHEHQQRYTFFARRYGGCRVLDAACGVGYGSQIIVGAGAAGVVGIDVSAEAIRYASTHFQSPITSFIQGDVASIPLPDHFFDVVISFETIEHLTCPDLFLREIRRVLKPNGVFVCSTPNGDFSNRQQHKNIHHLSEMNFARFYALLAAHFTVEEQYYQTHSESYLRHLDLVAELERAIKPARFSKLLRVERSARNRLGKESWDDQPLAEQLSRSVQGDYVIGALAEPSTSYLTFILVGRAS